MGKMILNGKEYAGGSGVSELQKLDDVSIASLANGQILRYDSVLGKFINKDMFNVDSILTNSEKSTGVRLVSRYIGTAPGPTGTTTLFPFATFHSGWDDITGIIIERQGVYGINFGVNGSINQDHSSVYTIVHGGGATAPSLSYDSSTHLLSIRLFSWEYAWFIGVISSARFVDN